MISVERSNAIPCREESRCSARPIMRRDHTKIYKRGHLFDRRVSTPTSPPTRALCDPSEVTTCVPSDAYVLGVTRRPSVACSAST